MTSSGGVVESGLREKSDFVLGKRKGGPSFKTSGLLEVSKTTAAMASTRTLRGTSCTRKKNTFPERGGRKLSRNESIVLPRCSHIPNNFSGWWGACGVPGTVLPTEDGILIPQSHPPPLTSRPAESSGSGAPTETAELGGV